MRIYRDTRFSKDKSPYKTNIGGIFWQGKNKADSPGFGFHLEATGMGLMAGMFHFSPETLTVYRDRVNDPETGEELTEAIVKVQNAGNYEIGGEHYKRVPAGYDQNHKRGSLLRHDGLYVFSPQISLSDVHSPELVDVCYSHFQKMAPIFMWLVKTLTP
jgi:uncharacterized protein (TIGR02453 family)